MRFVSLGTFSLSRWHSNFFSTAAATDDFLGKIHFEFKAARRPPPPYFPCNSREKGQIDLDFSFRKVAILVERTIHSGLRKLKMSHLYLTLSYKHLNFPNDEKRRLFWIILVHCGAHQKVLKV